jgi:hypothetical protein
LSRTTYLPNDLADELDALAVVARTLAGLDPAARERVLGWAIARFDVSEPAPRTRAMACQVADPALSVDGVELFDPKSASESVDETLTLPAPPATPPGVESMVRGFVTDFQRLVIEWQGV